MGRYNIAFFASFQDKVYLPLNIWVDATTLIRSHAKSSVCLPFNIWVDATEKTIGFREDDVYVLIKTRADAALAISVMFLPIGLGADTVVLHAGQMQQIKIYKTWTDLILTTK